MPEASPSCATPVVWGKNPEAPYPLAAHMLDTAVVIGAVWDQWLRPGLRHLITQAIAPGDPARARSLVALMGALHDVGKANPLFQLQEADSRARAWRQGLTTSLASNGLGATPDAVLGHVRHDSSSAARRHEFVGFRTLAGGYPGYSRNDFVRAHWMATVVGGHHGRWTHPDERAHDAVDMLLRDGWADQQQAHVNLVATALGVSPHGLPALGDSPGRTLLLLSGLLVLADWIASDDAQVGAGSRLYAAGLDPTTNPVGWLEARHDELEAHVAATLPAVRSLGSATEVILGSRPPRPLQREALDLGSEDGGLWLVMYPTGEGKTEAALLRHALRPDEQMIFALPTRATTDAMDRRLDRILSQTGNAVYLSHQFAAARPARSRWGCEDLARSEWFTSSVRRLVAPFVAATCDQVLAASLRQRHSPLRLLALANHHVILDEVHTFDEYQTDLLRELLAWLGATGTRVTLLSATLPERQAASLRNSYAAGAAGVKKKELPYRVTYPGHSLLDPAREIDRVGPAGPGPLLDGEVPDIHIEVVRTDEPERAHIEWGARVAAAHRSSPLAIVVNTVDAAVTIAAELSRTVSTHETLCLHSRMTLQHRNAIEERVRDRIGPGGWSDGTAESRPIILVGTQVIEASLDIDVDNMSTSLAPAPSMLQRAGRLWRFGESPTRRDRTAGGRTLTVVAVVDAHGEPTERGSLPYPASQLARTLHHLTSSSVIRVPEDVQSLVDQTHRPETSAEVVSAAREVSIAAIKIASAHQSSSKLTELLAVDRRLYWNHLAGVTNRNDAEELMRTRYIDQPGLTFVVLDSRPTKARSEWAAPESVSAAEMQRARPHEALTFLPFSMPVSQSLARQLYAAHELTLGEAGFASWEPESRMLRGLLPLDLAWVAQCRYDDLTGLTKEAT